jgi:hypothetical protein
MSDEMSTGLVESTVNGAESPPIPTMEDFLTSRLADAKAAIHREIDRLTEERDTANARLTRLRSLLVTPAPKPAKAPVAKKKTKPRAPVAPRAKGPEPTIRQRVLDYVKTHGPCSVPTMAKMLKMTSGYAHVGVNANRDTLMKYPGPDGSQWVRLVGSTPVVPSR